MRHGRWRVRRTAVRARLLVALTALTFTVTLLIAGILGQTQRDSVDGVRHYLAGLDGVAGVAQFATSLSDDPGQQDQAFESLMADQFGDLPVITQRRLVSAQYQWEPGAGETDGTGETDGSGGTDGTGGTADNAQATSVRLGSYDDVAAHSTITAGDWPTAAGDGPIQVAVAADTAAAYGLEVGDSLEVKASAGARRDLSVTAVFERDDSTFWWAEQTLLTGRGVADRSPVLMVDPSVLTGSSSVPTVSWTVVPDVAAIQPDDVAPLATAINELPAAVRGDSRIDINGTLSGGTLGDSLGVVQASLDAAVVATPLPIMLVVAFGLVMLLQLGRLLTEDRRSETSLLKSRGLSAGRLAVWATIESSIFAVVGAAAGLLAARLITGLTTAGWWAAAACTVVAVLAMAGPAWQMGVSRLLRDRMEDSGRRHSAMAWTLLVLLLVAAGFTIWRFRSSGAEAVTDVDGRRVLDPAVLLAPPVTLIALVAVGLVVFGLLSGTVQRLSARASTGLPLVLPARQVARRRTVFGAVVMMLGLAVGGSAVAAGYADTATEFQRQTAVADAGADVRVVTAGGLLSGSSAYRDLLGDFRQLDGVVDSAPVLRLDTDAADSSMTLVGIDSEKLQTVAGQAPGFDAAAAAAALRPGENDTKNADSKNAAAPAIPNKATELVATIDVEGATDSDTADLTGTAWVLSVDGALAPAALVVDESSGPGEPTQLRGRLSGLAPGSRLLAIDVRFARMTPTISFGVRVSSVAAGTEADSSDTGGADTGDATELDVSGWAHQQLPGDTMLEQWGDGPAAQMAANGRQNPGPLSARFMAPDEGEGSLPVLFDRQTLQTLGLEQGRRIGLQYGPVDIPVQMAGSSDSIPGFPSGSVALADLTGLQTVLLRNISVLPATSEIWLASSDPDATREAAADVAGPAATVTEVGAGSVDALLRPAVRSLWWGVAGALLLGAVGVLLVIATLSRSRRAEIAVLRAFGVPSRMQATMRSRELLGTAVASWILGLAAGIGTAVLIVPGLSRQGVVATGSVPNPPLSFAWATWAVLIGVHLVLVLATIGWHWWTIRRHAATADPREVTA